jgi:8-amino-7-oxononanoate synthase
MTDYINRKLMERTDNGAFRVLHSVEEKIDFCSNDYLGLSKFDITLKSTAHSGTGSRLIAGSNLYSLNAENELAAFFNAESALVFNSGYDANIGLFSALLTKECIVLFDEHIHASVRDGVRLGVAKNHHFKHNSITDLERLLKTVSDGTHIIYVAIESLYSMGGDVAPINEILNLCSKYQAKLIVDEAHAGGVFGEFGRGVCVDLGVEHLVYARVFTFGKGFGSHGAVVVSGSDLKNYLINFARSFIYTTALPSFVYERLGLLFSIHCSKIEEERIRLIAVINAFVANASELNLLSDKRSPIQILPLAQFQRDLIIEALPVSTIGVKAIFAPTVPISLECLRICLHSFNTKEEISDLISFLRTFKLK